MKRVWFALIVLGIGTLNSVASAAEKPDAVDAYEHRLREIRALIGKACAGGGLDEARLGYGPHDLAMMRDPFRLHRFDAHIADPLLLKVHYDSVGAWLKRSAARPDE
jgi:hypothetical protein